MNRPLQEFLFYLKNQLNYSDATINSYRLDCEKFLNFLLKEDILMDDVDTVVIRNFLACELNSGVKKRSCARRVSALKLFYEYLYKNQYIKINPFLLIEPLKVPKSLPETLYQEQIEKIIETNKLRKDELVLRDQAILEVLNYTGIRVSELVHIKLTDVDYVSRVIRVLGKGNKERIVPFSNSCKETLLKYTKELRPTLALRSPEFTTWLFLNNKGKHLTVSGVEQILDKVEEKTGIFVGLHPHILRHSLATRLLENGADIRVIQEILGHESINTTQIYTHVSKEAMKTAYDNCFPRAKKK